MLRKHYNLLTKKTQEPSRNVFVECTVPPSKYKLRWARQMVLSCLLIKKPLYNPVLNTNYENLFGVERVVEESSIENIPQQEPKTDLDNPPTREEINTNSRSTKQVI